MSTLKERLFIKRVLFPIYFLHFVLTTALVAAWFGGYLGWLPDVESWSAIFIIYIGGLVISTQLFLYGCTILREPSDNSKREEEKRQ